MPETQQKVCQICNSSDEKNLRPACLVSEQIVKLIQSKRNWDESAWICTKDLNYFRNAYVENLIHEEKGEISDLEKTFLESLNTKELVASNLDAFSDKNLTRWERVADRLAEFGGSWAFITLFLVLIAIWIALNSIFLVKHRFDPYPFYLFEFTALVYRRDSSSYYYDEPKPASRPRPTKSTPGLSSKSKS